MKLILMLLFQIFFFHKYSDEKNQKIFFQSAAFDLKKGNFLYNEIHIEEYSPSGIVKSETDYADKNGNIITKRIMTFGADSTRPDYKLEDLRTGYLEGAKLIGIDSVEVVFRENRNSSIKKNILSIEKPFVIDGGLTFFFRQNWDNLIKGKMIEFNFVTPAKLDYFKFRVMKNDIKYVNGIKGLELKLEPASFIIRQFVDPIFITYDFVTRKILFYEGISNINNENGKSFSVKIDYTTKEKN